ncbi:MAG: helix-turn-helix transcriptional regulator [Gemmatimonadaceae bacterium]
MPMRSTPALSPARFAVIDAVRRGHHTVNALASALGVSDNAVRMQLSALERDGFLVRRGVVHSGRAGQPAAEYELSRSGEDALSRAYRPVLTALVSAIGKRLDPRALRNLFADAGRTAAPEPHVPSIASLATRATACVGLVESLGGTATVRVTRGQAILEGAGCPLSSAVREEPATCFIMESLLAQHAGLRARQRCTHGEQPCCRFELSLR